jgi:hypothetical protein
MTTGWSARLAAARAGDDAAFSEAFEATYEELRRRKMSGWTLFFYARLVSLVANVLSGAVVSALLVALISLYVLFQVPLYKA